MKKFQDYLITPQQITIIFNEGHPLSVRIDDPRYHDLLTALRSKDYDAIIPIIDRPTQINQYTKGRFLVRDGIVHVNNEALPDALSSKLLQLIDAKEETRPLERFWEHLKQNPSEESRKDLFAFLQVNKVPITPKGCFIAYRRVRSDYKDFYTGKMDNTPGAIVKMDRKTVNSNRQQTCSTGLHVAAFNYADKHYHSGEGLLLEVEVNPRDVVAVPPDYNQQKMRVCRFKVLRRAVDGELDDLVYRRYGAKTY